MKRWFVAVICILFLGCDNESRSVKPLNVFSCIIKDGVNAEMAEKILVSELRSLSYEVESGDHKALSSISGRPGHAFHLWVSSKGRTVATINNIKNKDIAEVNLYELGLWEKLVKTKNGVCPNSVLGE